MTFPTPPDRPLAGKRVLVTRTREQAGALAEALRERGAVPVELPTIQIVAPLDWAPVDRAVRALDSYDWLVFSSANAVRYFFERLAGHTGPLHPKIAAVGSATARALAERGQEVDVVPGEFVAEAVVAELARHNIANRRVLVPCAEETRDALIAGISALGASVDRVVVYRTLANGDPEFARYLFAENPVDIVTLTSSSTGRSLVALLGADGPQLLQPVVIASIGPITSATARELGLHVSIEASDSTIPGLVDALERYFRQA